MINEINKRIYSFVNSSIDSQSINKTSNMNFNKSAASAKSKNDHILERSDKPCKCCDESENSIRDIEANQLKCLLNNYVRFRVNRTSPISEKEMKVYRNARNIGNLLSTILSFKVYPIDTSENFTIRMAEEYLHGLWIKTFKKTHPINLQLTSTELSNFTSTEVFYKGI